VKPKDRQIAAAPMIEVFKEKYIASSVR